MPSKDSSSTTGDVGSERSAHSSVLSVTAWESVIGQDDPTLPITNVRAAETTPSIADSATVGSFVTAILDVGESDEEREPKEVPKSDLTD